MEMSASILLNGKIAMHLLFEIMSLIYNWVLFYLQVAMRLL